MTTTSTLTTCQPASRTRAGRVGQQHQAVGVLVARDRCRGTAGRCRRGWRRRGSRRSPRGRPHRRRSGRAGRDRRGCARRRGSAAGPRRRRAGRSRCRCGRPAAPIALRARSRSAAVVIFTLASSPATTRTSWPACSASIASSVPEAPRARRRSPRPARRGGRPAASAPGTASRAAASPRSTSRRRAGDHLLDGVVHRHRRHDGAAGEGAVDGAIDHGGG